ncbi:MAG TPA: DcaP family trimeric outer membrane transporter [Candidatus Sulfotelmatobacter sp.]|nr:DcaP family trimeric outer membrane transporter [Candidatus Sulfotelmatobacter sp.]
MRRPTPRFALILLASLAWTSAGGAFVANSAPASPSTARPATSRPAAKPKRDPNAARISALQDTISAQQRRLDQAQARLDEQSRVIDRQNAGVDSLRQDIAATQQSIHDLQQQIDFFRAQMPDSAYRAALEKRLKEVETEAAQPPELPPDTISADFPGGIRIPGSDAAIKFGGRVRASYVLTLNPLGTDDRFLTNSIPVAVTQVAGEARRVNFSARTSRLNFEFRTPGGAGQVRSFIEGDFAGTAGTSNAFRLRHAYAQYQGVIVGQTWSTFSDPETQPQDLDFEGLSSENVIRQPQVRYWLRNSKGTRWAFAAETPLVSASGGQGVNLVPDLVVRGVRSDSKGGHLQLAAVLRQLRVQPDSFPGKVVSDQGWGASVSGVVMIPKHGPKDRLVFQANGGRGIARYVNDLNSLGGSDAVVNPSTGELKPLPVFGWYVDYEHEWNNWQDLSRLRFRSCLLWSVVGVDNLDFQPPSAYRSTDRIAGNVIISPNSRIDVGLEYLYGTRENKDGQRASANQVQIVSIINF